MRVIESKEGWPKLFIRKGIILVVGGVGIIGVVDGVGIMEMGGGGWCEDY